MVYERRMKMEWQRKTEGEVWETSVSGEPCEGVFTIKRAEWGYEPGKWQLTYLGKGGSMKLGSGYYATLQDAQASACSLAGVATSKNERQCDPAYCREDRQEGRREGKPCA